MDKQDHTEIVVGRQPVMELFRAGQAINQLYVASGSRHGSIRRILQLAKENNVPVKRVQPHLLDSMSPVKNHQGIAAKVALSAIMSFMICWQWTSPNSTWCWREFKTSEFGFLNPHCRSLRCERRDYSQAQGLCCHSCSNQGISGAVSHMPIARVTNLASALGSWIRDAGLQCRYG